MWKYFGTIVNVCMVIAGSLIGMGLRRRGQTSGASEKLTASMMFCLGLCVIFAAASGLIGVENGTQAIVVVASMVLGFLTGYGLKLDRRINRLGARLIERVSGAENESNPAAGFVMACLLFCVGSMTFMGSFESAANPKEALELSCHTTLIIKSLLDLVTAACLSVRYGASVMASAAFVLVFQGLLTLLASFVQPFLASINAMPMLNCVGSLILLGIAVDLMGLKKTDTADFLPALVYPVLICMLLRLFGLTI